jgi:hypothetical protein
MYTEERYRTVQVDLFKSDTLYPGSHPHHDQAQLVLISVAEIENVHDQLCQKYDDERHWYQQQLITKAINSVASVHLLTWNQFYDSAYRDVRTLIETYLILNYMNDHKIETAREFLRQEREIFNSDLEASSGEWQWEELHIEDAFHDMLQKEKSRLKNTDHEFGRLFNLLSNRNVHPIRIDGVDVDRNYSEEEDLQLLRWQLDILLGLIIQLIKLYSDTEGYSGMKESLEPVWVEIEENHEPDPLLEVGLENFPEEI